MLIIGHIDLSPFLTLPYDQARAGLVDQLHSVYRAHYEPEHVIRVDHFGDLYVQSQPNRGIVLRLLVQLLRETDITPSFVQLHTTNRSVDLELAHLSQGDYPMAIVRVAGHFQRLELERDPYSRAEQYQYGSANPIKISLNDISEQDKFLLSASKNFCIYPWIHMHAWPTGEAYPCCHATQLPVYGNTKKETLAAIWNGTKMRQLRQDMRNDTPNETCRKCHEQEDSGFFSGRQSANKHHGHHIDRVHRTQPDGTFREFEMTYWDIRFSNLCNLKCRSCGHIFSSQWYQDQAQLAGPAWRDRNTVLNYAGRTETDMWSQLLPHLDHVEQIYFAGGEPLLMEEHYHILDELVRRRRFDVRLIYNTNFTHTDLKGRSVFEYWNQFESVAVGASLDAAGARGEYIRKGTRWAQVEQNRRDMLEICPQVDFYISPTLSIMNALHLPDFHRDWVERGLLRPQDLNVNILQDPYEYRIDIATPEYKHEIRQKYLAHIEWLRPQDHLHRATVGFESAITYMMSTDNTHLIPKFWSVTEKLDEIRKENILDVLPELKALK